MSKKALQKAIKQAGSQSALARKIGKTQGHVSKWLERGDVPADMVLAIETATGVARHELRKDIYPATDYGGFAEDQQQPVNYDDYRDPRMRAADLLAIKPKWTVAEIDALEEEGKLAQERWELLDGVITPMQAKGNWHEPLKAALHMFWARRLPDAYVIIGETTYRLDPNTFVEPDFTFYPKASGWTKMSSETVPLVVEVADTSKRYDLGKKAGIYAKFGMRELWVIEARDQITHIHKNPSKKGYASVQKFDRDKLLTPDFCPELAVKLSELELY
jgi:Uma2 family endonuclease